MKKYTRIWIQLLKNSFSSTLSNRIDSASYFFGKLIRFGFFWLLIISIFNFTETFAGYSTYQVLFFFLTFNLIDILGQIFFRGIYLFSSDVRKGNFDFTLTKPVPALFLTMSRLIDLLDIIFILPIVGLLVYAGIQLPVTITIGAILVYLFLVLLATVLSFTFHVIIAAATIWSFENENFIWLYREAMTLGRLPPDIFPVLLQYILTYGIPIIVMIAYPVNALFGLLSVGDMLFAGVITLLFIAVSLVLWKIALRSYSSASS